jgi:hypothetical protein
MTIGTSARLALALKAYKPTAGCGAELAGWAAGVHAVLVVCEKYVDDERFKREQFLKLADCPEHW